MDFRQHNTIEVTVIGTLKNTLGPHHGKPALGTAWPAMFQKAPSPGPPADASLAGTSCRAFEMETSARWYRGPAAHATAVGRRRDNETSRILMAPLPVPAPRR